MQKGKLFVRAGAMFSGKSSWLNFELTKYADLGYDVVKIVHSDDTRENTDNAGSTHNSSYQSLSSKIRVIHANILQYPKITSHSVFNNCENKVSYVTDIEKYEVIGIDEGQFFTGLYDFVYDLIENHGKLVMVVGLDGDSNKRKFGEILNLIPIADKFKKMSACCQLCPKKLFVDAPFTKCLVKKEGQVLIGAKNEYIPVCRVHHDIHYDIKEHFACDVVNTF